MDRELWTLWMREWMLWMGMCSCRSVPLRRLLFLFSPALAGRGGKLGRCCKMLPAGCGGDKGLGPRVKVGV